VPISSPSSPTIIPAQQTSAGNVKRAAAQLSKTGGDDAASWATASQSFTSVQQQIDSITRALQQPVPIPNPLQITAANGALIAEIGSLIDPTTNTGYSGIWGNNLYVGGTGPATAPFFSSEGGNVVVGQNGQVDVLDPYGNIGAWLGTEVEAPRTVSGAIADGSGQVQLTVTAHPYRNGDWVNAVNVGGVPNATGQWVISAVATNTFSLTGSTFAGAYSGGGTVTRFFSGGAFETIAVAAGQRITNAVNNGSGLVRLTITGHGYSTGFDVTTTNVQGVPGANGTFLVTVIDANTVDLQGSQFSGAYVSGGISINWPTAKLLAQGDGSLLIRDATIILNGTGGSIVIDPTIPSITVTGAGGTIVIDASVTDIVATDLGGNYAKMSPGEFVVSWPAFGQIIINEVSITMIGASLVEALNLGLDNSGNATFIFSSVTGSKAVGVNTAATGAILAVDGGSVNVTGGVYELGGVPGLSTSRSFATSFTTAANGVFGTPAAGQFNSQVVTSASLTASTFSGGILTA
jgi:hypothetical protein